MTTIPDINEGQRQESTVIQLSRSPSPRIFRSPVARAFKFPPSLAKMMKQHPEEESKVKHHRRDGSYSSTTTLLSVSSEKTSLALKGDQPPFDPVIPSKVNSGPKSVTFGISKMFIVDVDWQCFVFLDKRLSIQSKPPPSTQVERKRSSRRRHKLRILVRQKYNQYACYIYKYATLLYQWVCIATVWFVSFLRRFIGVPWALCGNDEVLPCLFETNFERKNVWIQHYCIV